MTRGKSDSVYLDHILDAIGCVEEYTREGREAFMRDRKTQHAVIRNLEVIGEAVKHLSGESRDRHPEIPWNRMAGMRDVLIHEYFGVNLETVWNVVEHRLHELKAAVQDLLRRGDAGS